MKRLLITGASGFLGRHCIAEALRQGWSVTACVNIHPLEIPGAAVIRQDLADTDGTKAVFALVKPDAVVHLAALPDPNACQRDPALSEKINVGVSVNLAGLCAGRAIPFVFTSTDLVFDGLHAPYRECDPLCPISVYGEHKAAAECRILERHSSAAVCRMPLMFGDAGPYGKSFIQPMIAALREGRALKLFTDEYRTPVGGTTAAKGLLLMLGKGYSGIIHLGGRERVSRFAFGQLLAGVLGIKTPHLTPSLQKDMVMIAPRPPDVSLDSSKAFGLGYDPAPLREELLRIDAIG